MSFMRMRFLLSHNIRSVRRQSTSVLYYDDNLVVLNKGPNLISQDNSDHSGDLGQLLQEIQTNFKFAETPYPLHRLDKLTSGCLLFGRNSRTTRNIAVEFQRGNVEKYYLALVHAQGKAKQLLHDQGSGRIQTKITSSKDGRPSLSLGEGIEAVTEWQLLASSPKLDVSLVRLNLLTGRKHQLRLHMAHYLQAPILRDTIYGPLKHKLDIHALTLPGRIYLHASRISFTRYGPGGRYQFGIQAPVPTYFAKAVRKAGIPFLAQYMNGAVFKNNISINADELGGHWMPAI